MRSSRGPARSTPRTQLAASAMSDVRTETSRVAEASGGGSAPPAPARAFSAVSRISAQARDGCRLCAAIRLTGSLTTAACTPGISAAVSSHAGRSPVTSTTGTP